jgi:cell wall-associated NlpC family hydrolase
VEREPRGVVVRLTGEFGQDRDRERRPTWLMGRWAWIVVVVIFLAGCGSSTPARDGKEQAPATKSAADKKIPAPTVTDSEAADEYALPAGVRGVRSAPSPGNVPAATRLKSTVSPGAPSDAEIRAELREMNQALKHARTFHPGHLPKLTPKGNVEVPDGVPQAVAAIFAGGNAIARFPYVYGGGHRSFIDTAYDCSASVSYALAAAGLLGAPITSGQLARWGAPGPGKWVTIYANAQHAYMVVAGIRFDTSGRAGPLGSRWQAAMRSGAGFTVRHPSNL